MNCPEDLLTDSPVNILMQSDEQFKEKRIYLIRTLQNNALAEWWTRDCQWDRKMTKQFLAVLEKRSSYCLPLPEPLDMASFEDKDIFAIFSKMHSRAFARSMRLSKNVNKFLSDNLEKYSIRIRNGELEINAAKVLCFRRENLQSNWVSVGDPLSILPFSFARFNGVWDGETFHEVFDQMKKPFEHLQIELKKDCRLITKPWMIHLDVLSIAKDDREDWTDEVLFQTWKLVQELKPKELRFPGNTQLPLTELLDSAPNVFISLLSEDLKLSELVREWRSGEWNHRAITLSGNCAERFEDIAPFVQDCPIFHQEMNSSRLIFVSSPVNDYLVLQLSGRRLVSFKIMLNIRTISDIIAYQPDLLQRLFPVDYSSYSGDIDSVIDPHVFCALFTNYELGERPIPPPNLGIKIKCGCRQPFPRI